MNTFNLHFGKLGEISCGNGCDAISKRNPISCPGTARQNFTQYILLIYALWMFWAERNGGNAGEQSE